MPRSAGISVISPRLTLAKFLRAGSAPAAGALLLVLWSSSSGVSRFRFAARKIFFSAHRHSHGRTSGNVKFGLKLRCFFFNPLAAPLPELALATASYRPEMHTKHGQFWIFSAAAQCISAALGDGDRKKKAEKKTATPRRARDTNRTGSDRISTDDNDDDRSFEREISNCRSRSTDLATGPPPCLWVCWCLRFGIKAK